MVFWIYIRLFIVTLTDGETFKKFPMNITYETHNVSIFLCMFHCQSFPHQTFALNSYINAALLQLNTSK